MNKDAQIPMLMDVYGSVLSPAQYECLESYYSSDLSLTEISGITNKSRQGVFECIKRAESILKDMEIKLGFLQKMSEIVEDFSRIESLLKTLNFSDNSDQTLSAILQITNKYKND